MKKYFITTVIGVLFAFVLTASLHTVNTERQIAKWQNRMETVEKVEEYNQRVFMANNFARDMLVLAQHAVEQNTILFEREQKLNEVIAEYEESNRLLKSSLAEAVEIMQVQQKEIERLEEALNATTKEFYVYETAFIVLRVLGGI